MSDTPANTAVVGVAPGATRTNGRLCRIDGEDEVVSVFKTTGRPDRPRQIEPRHRTEGLVLGFRATGLSREEPSLPLLSASDIPYSWSLSTSGTLHITTGVPSRPTRAISA